MRKRESPDSLFAPKILHKHTCLLFLLGTTVIPEKVMQSFGGQTRCIMGDVQVVNSYFQIFVVFVK